MRVTNMGAFGRYIYAVDPEMFESLRQAVDGAKTFANVGRAAAACDPELYEAWLAVGA